MKRTNQNWEFLVPNVGSPETVFRAVCRIIRPPGGYRHRPPAIDISPPVDHPGGWRRSVQPVREDPLRVFILLTPWAPARVQPHPRTGRDIERLGKNRDTPSGGMGSRQGAKGGFELFAVVFVCLIRQVGAHR
jgi:hypothetical protein